MSMNNITIHFFKFYSKLVKSTSNGIHNMIFNVLKLDVAFFMFILVFNSAFNKKLINKYGRRR